MSEISETTTEAARIWGQKRRLWRCNDKPEKLATMTEALVEKYDPEESTKMTKALAEEGEETTRLKECLRRQRRWRVYGPMVLTTATVASTEEYVPAELAKTMEIDDASEGLETTTEAAASQ